MEMIKQLALGAATLILILGLAVASNAALDRLSFGRSACVDARGSWKNWGWPNVPTLSPRCSDDSPAPAAKE
jgi:hypothetical protein